MRDEELLLLLKKDPERGISALADEYGALLYSVVKAKLQNSEYYSSDIEDCVSDTIVKFYVDLGSYKPSRGSIASYLSVIARNKAIDVLRRRGIEKKYFEREEDIFLEDERFVVEEEMLDADLISKIISEINMLSSPDKEIIYRKFYLSQSSSEIAKALSLSESNVNVRVYRVIKKLREKVVGV